MTSRARSLAIALLAGAAAFLGAGAAAFLGAGAASANTLSPAGQSVSFLTAQVGAYAGPLGPYGNGIWHSTNTVCWACNNGGPATAAATAYMLTGESRPSLLQAAEGTIDTAIATRQNPDGSFSPPAGDSQPDGIATIFFSLEMGNTYKELSSVLDPARRGRWQRSLAAVATYLIRNGNVTWYTNGNINLGIVELFYLAWNATGNEAFHTAYEQAWTFTLSPPQSRWPGCGLVVVNAPNHADGSDGAGYLAEIGAGGTGFDAEYTELQLDVASRLYLLSGDPRALRLANLLVNVLLPRVDSSWMLDTSGGTRHTELSRKVPFMTSAFTVLGLDGGRSDLVTRIAPELAAIEASYTQPWNAYSEVYRRALGNDIAVIALAGNRVGAPVSAHVRRQTSSKRRHQPRHHHATRHHRRGGRHRSGIVARHRPRAH